MTQRRHRLRRTLVTLVAFGLAFAGLAPSALGATGESGETPTFGAAVADASATREPTGAAARVTAAASEVAGRGSTAREAYDTSGDDSPDRRGDAPGEGSDDPAGPTDSAANENGESRVRRAADESATLGMNGEPSVERAVDQSTSDVRDQTRRVSQKAATTVTSAARRAGQTARQQAKPIVEKAHENVEETVVRVEITLAATRKPVIDGVLVVVGRGVDGYRGGTSSEAAPDAAQPTTTAPTASGHAPRAGGGPREPLSAREALGPVGPVTRVAERFVSMPATAASAPPSPPRPSAAPRARGDGLSKQAAPRQAQSTGAPADSARLTPLGDPGPSEGLQRAPGGGLSSMSVMLGAAAATIAAFCLAAPSVLRLLRLSPAVVRPVAYVSLLERPG